MAKKYIKNEKGIVRAVTTDNLQLEKPLANENYDIEVHNRNMDKIDSAIQEVKGKIDGLELVASNVKMADGTTVQTTVTTNKSNISTLQSEVSANKTSILNNTNLATQALNKANEAFQRGDNVKTQLVDKLISEGLDVSTNNTFEELIGNIALGKKWASGEIELSVKHKSNATIQMNLDFEPSRVLVFCPLFWYPNKSVYLRNAVFDSVHNNANNKYTYEGSSQFFVYFNNVNRNSFKLYIEGGSAFGGCVLNVTKWIAYE